MWWLEEDNKKGWIANYLDGKVQEAKEWFAEFLQEWLFNILTLTVDILSAYMLVMILVFLTRLIYTYQIDGRKKLLGELSDYVIGLCFFRLLGTIFPIIAQGVGV